MNWSAWLWTLWLAAFFVLEALGLFWKSSHSMTLTFFIQHHFQKGFLLALIAWLAYHFLIAKPALKVPNPLDSLLAQQNAWCELVEREGAADGAFAWDYAEHKWRRVSDAPAK